MFDRDGGGCKPHGQGNARRRFSTALELEGVGRYETLLREHFLFLETDFYRVLVLGGIFCPLPNSFLATFRLPFCHRWLLFCLSPFPSPLLQDWIHF